MQCNNCGANLVRGFSFCLDCGMPVPLEALEESGLPQRNIDSGVQETPKAPNAAKNANEDTQTEVAGDVKPQMQGLADERSGKNLKPQLVGGEAGVGGSNLKPRYVGFGEETAGAALKAKPIGGDTQSTGGTNVRAAMQESTSSSLSDSVEKLVFCSNCGMRMQHNRNVCEKCGMPLGNAPNNAMSQSNGIPLFNNDADPFADQFGGFGGALGGISDADAARIDNFMNGAGGLDPMFNSVDVPLSVNATPNDFTQLNEQLANFSSGLGISQIEAVESTYVRQKEPKRGEEREMVDFQLNDDLSTEPLAMSLNSVRVVDDYSMEENPAADIDLDPYKFLGNSMDEIDPAFQDKIGAASKSGIEPISPPIPEIKAAKPTTPVREKTEAPKAEAAPKVEKAPKAKDTPKTEEVRRPEKALKVEEPPKAEKAHKVEEAPKTEKAHGAENAPKTVKTTNAKEILAEDDDLFIEETTPFIEEFSAQGIEQTSSAPEPKSKSAPEPKAKSAPEPKAKSEQPPAPAAAAVPYVPYEPQDQGLLPSEPFEQAVNMPPGYASKRCAFCGGMNLANTAVCYNCGRLLTGVPNATTMSGKKRTALIIAIIAAVIAFVVVVVILGVKASAEDIEPFEPNPAASDAARENAEHILPCPFGGAL